METKNAKDVAIAIRKTLTEKGVAADKPTIEELEKEIAPLLKWSVPVGEITKNLTIRYALANGVELTSQRSDSEEVKIGDIAEKEKWVTITGKVVKVYDNQSPKVFQSGLIGDETGVLKFITFMKSTEGESKPGQFGKLQEGKVYRLHPVVTDEYNGRYSVKLNRNTEITEVDQKVEVKEKEPEIFTGVIVQVQKGTGLIKRCPQCKRALSKGACLEHGRQEGVYDTRIKAVIDNGTEAKQCIMDAAMTQKVTGIDVATAKKMAMDAVDPGVVMEDIKNLLTGKRYTIKCNDLDGKTTLVKDIEPAKPIVVDVDAVLKEIDEVV